MRETRRWNITGCLLTLNENWFRELSKWGRWWCHPYSNQWFSKTKHRHSWHIFNRTQNLTGVFEFWWRLIWMREMIIGMWPFRERSPEDIFSLVETIRILKISIKTSIPSNYLKARHVGGKSEDTMACIDWKFADTCRYLSIARGLANCLVSSLPSVIVRCPLTIISLKNK